MQTIVIFARGRSGSSQVAGKIAQLVGSLVGAQLAAQFSRIPCARDEGKANSERKNNWTWPLSPRRQNGAPPLIQWPVYLAAGRGSERAELLAK